MPNSPIPLGPTTDPRLHGFVGLHPGFLSQVAKLPRYAACPAGVLIQGETGTGKEVFAQAIHYLSPRAPRPWVAVNCGAIPVELVESELFGHVRGAYTSALGSRAGLVAEAEGGTLFLDDIDCLPLLAQAKLLRFLQEHEYRAVGTNAGEPGAGFDPRHGGATAWWRWREGRCGGRAVISRNQGFAYL